MSDAVLAIAELLAAMERETRPGDDEFTFADLRERGLALDDSSARARLLRHGFRARRAGHSVFYSYHGLSRDEAIKAALNIMPKPLDQTREVCIALVARASGISKDVAARRVQQLVRSGRLRACGERVHNGAIVNAYELVDVCEDECE